jgi:hypothetical protein
MQHRADSIHINRHDVELYAQVRTNLETARRELAESQASAEDRQARVNVRHNSQRCFF